MPKVFIFPLKRVANRHSKVQFKNILNILIDILFEYKN